MLLPPRSEEANRILHLLAGLVLDGERSIGSALARLREEGLLDLPKPGSGSTELHHDALAEIAAADLSLARLAEGHDDAIQILAELEARPHPGSYGVWAAEPPDAKVVAKRTEAGWRLDGTKRYASGARVIDRALVTATAEEGVRLFDVSLRTAGLVPVDGTWPAIGMHDSGSVDVTFTGVEVDRSAAVGAPGAYVARPGFGHGGVRVAACWFGGALGAARMVERRLKQPNEHQLAHFGAIVVACRSMRDVLDAAAAAVDAEPLAIDPTRALHVRSAVEQGAQDVLARCGRAAGSSALVYDHAHARRAADLVVYLRQHHAERDLAELGRMALCSS